MTENTFERIDTVEDFNNQVNKTGDKFFTFLDGEFTQYTYLCKHPYMPDTIFAMIGDMSAVALTMNRLFKEKFGSELPEVYFGKCKNGGSFAAHRMIEYYQSKIDKWTNYIQEENHNDIR